MNEHGQFTDVSDLAADKRREITENSRRIKKEQDAQRNKHNPALLNKELEETKAENKSLKEANSDLMSKMDAVLAKLDEVSKSKTPAEPANEKKGKDTGNKEENSQGKDNL